MPNEKSIKLLNDKIKQIDDLVQNYNQENLRQWREETLMILDSLIQQESKYYQNFEDINFNPSIVMMDEPEENRRESVNAYNRGLEESRASLKAIVYGVEQGLI